AVVRQTIVPVIAQGEALARSFTGSARDLLEQLVREYWRLVGETALAGIPKLMMAEAATFPELTRFYYDEVVTRGHRLMAGVIERGIENGEFRPVDVKVAAKLATSPLRRPPSEHRCACRSRTPCGSRRARHPRWRSPGCGRMKRTRGCARCAR